VIFVDASAIIAVMTREPDHERLIAAIEGAGSAITSPIAIFEAAAGLCRKRSLSVEEARSEVEMFLDICRIEAVPLSSDIAHEALDAFSRFGKGRGNKAQLNLGDCFAYAAAKRHKAALLFAGADFTATDIAVAT
jgi:ribonuclease VapC